MAFAFQVIGPGRGGTTLLACLIGHHPRCEILLEEFSRDLLMGRVDSSAELIPDLQTRTKQRIDNFLKACIDRAALTPDKLWGHKTTTEHIWHLRYWRGEPVPTDAFDPINEFLRQTSSIPVLFIQRDGRTCIPSKMRRAGLGLEAAISLWKFSVDFQRRLERSGNQAILIRFENLISRPEIELQRACDFLGVSYDPVMLTAVSSPKMPELYRRPNFDLTPTIINDDPPWAEQIQDELLSLAYARDELL